MRKYSENKKAEIISPPRRQDAKGTKKIFLKTHRSLSFLMRMFKKDLEFAFFINIFLASWRLGGEIVFFFFLFFSPFQVQAQQEQSTFLPVSPLFQPLIADPREPGTALIAHTTETRYEGEVGTFFELLRWNLPDKTHWGWGVFG